MTKSKFLEKWQTFEVGSWWMENPDRLFWARSYNITAFLGYILMINLRPPKKE